MANIKRILRKLQRQGNSTVVPIAPELLAKAGIEAGDYVELKLKGNKKKFRLELDFLK